MNTSDAPSTTTTTTTTTTAPSSSTTPAPPAHEHQQPPSPRPSTSHRRPSFSFPTPHLVDSIAGGAHYAGGIPVHHSTTGEPHVNGDDPTAEHHIKHRQVLKDLEEVYCGRVTLDILLRRFRREAEFEDPLCICKGFDEYAAQWFALQRLLSKSERTSTRILSATLTPNHLIYAQTQIYTFRLFGYTKTISSIILIDLDEDFRITRLIEKWDGKELPSSWGTRYLRRLSAKVVPWFVRVPKPQSRS
ncbi:hypothetical protein K474DRAFT_1641989 [Panus rudis PR-1116 ss-1]|nr:hypothetical protein K474DRAFT_1641989 [Panus rudis PR-1116 ss-1]